MNIWDIEKTCDTKLACIRSLLLSCTSFDIMQHSMYSLLHRTSYTLCHISLCLNLTI